MKSIKPGRASSGMSAVLSVFVATFGFIWTVMAFLIGAPPLFALFGVFFIIMAIVQGLYHYKNATSKNRFSSFDIVEDGEEPDPFDNYINRDNNNTNSSMDFEEQAKTAFCPYCGERVEGEYSYCPSCGKKLP